MRLFTAALLLQCFFPAALSLDEQFSLSLPTENVRTKSLISLHRDLVKTESISGNEHSVGQYLVSYLSAHDFTVDTQALGPLSTNAENSRFNVLAYRGSSSKSRVLVSSHIDTVPPFWPYEVRNQNDIWGRGTVDAKGCVATQITAVEELIASNDVHDGDVALLFVVGEEVGGDGMKKANDLNLTWEAAIFGEPTELKLATGHKGILSFKLSAKGKAGHSGYPWLGENANAMLIPALAELMKLEFPSSEKYGNTTVNIGRMEGGVAANVIAEDAFAQVAMRLAAGTPEDSKKIVVDALQKIDPRLQIDFASRGYGPVHIDSDVKGKILPMTL
jgi:acetylornithine deacetylase